MYDQKYFVEACQNITAGYTPGGKKENTFYSGVALAKMLQQIGAIQQNDTILDVGSGNGRLAMGLYQLNYQYYIGLEIIPQCVEFCRKTFRDAPGYQFLNTHNENRHYHKGLKTAEDVSYPVISSTIDSVIAMSFFSHTGTLNVARRHIAQIKFACKPYGRFYSTWFFGKPNSSEAKTVYDRKAIQDLFDFFGLTILDEGELYGIGNQNQTTLLARFNS